MSDKHKKLEEDIAAFPYPVFGLRESVYDLEYVDHYEEEGRFTICYQSRSKPPYRLSGRSLYTVSLESSFWPFPVVHGTSFYPYIEETIREEEVFEVFVAGTEWNRDLDIDGIRFKGAMLYQGSIEYEDSSIETAGWCYSSESHHSHIDGKAFGLSYEEVVGVLSALGKLK
jgi:hypothetical protein